MKGPKISKFGHVTQATPTYGSFYGGGSSSSSSGSSSSSSSSTRFLDRITRRL